MNNTNNKKNCGSILLIRTFIWVFFSVLSLPVWAASEVGEKPPPVEELRPGLLKGYLSLAATPNSLKLVPSPPAKNSTAFAFDEAMSKRAINLRNTPRWKLAASDADLSFPHAANIFACALNVQITEQSAPYLFMLLRRSLTDAGLSTYRAKNNYARQRPFMVNNEPICTPESKTGLEKDGSYPSGHSAIGWAWALILSEIAPDRADVILARGRAFGESRNVCNVHWYSDVVEGRLMGASTVARLHGDTQFLADLERAKKELSFVRAQSNSAVDDCAAEDDTLKNYSLWQEQ